MTATFEVTWHVLPCTTPRRWKTVDRTQLKAFWKGVAGAHRRGVYVLGVQASKGYKPLYVGQTKKQSFRKRIDQHVAAGNINRMLRGVSKGSVVLSLIGRKGKGRNSTSAIDILEGEFINYAFARNSDLHNDRRIRRPAYVIKGFGGRGKPTDAARRLKKLIGY